MASVTIDSDTYTAYASVDTADTYLNAAQHGDAWRALTDADDKARALVTATRILDRQRWKDAYDTVSEREVVQDIIDASIEMALSLVDGSDFQTQQTTEQKIQSLKAGSVALTFFRRADGTPTRFPQIVHELLRDYLAGPSSTLSGVSTGTGGESVSDNDYSYSESI